MVHTTFKSFLESTFYNIENDNEKAQSIITKLNTAFSKVESATSRARAAFHKKTGGIIVYAGRLDTHDYYDSVDNRMTFDGLLYYLNSAGVADLIDGIEEGHFDSKGEKGWHEKHRHFILSLEK
jgi:hypothetical protein